MAYYPKSQIKTNLYTNGGELVYKSNNQSYTGYYFKTSKEKYYTGKSPNDGTPVELIQFNSSIADNNSSIPNPSIQISELNSNRAITPVNDVPIQPDGIPYPTQVDSRSYPNKIQLRFIPLYYKTQPTPEELRLGKYNRYFCKKNNELIYLEISKETYTKLINQDPQIAYDLYTPTSILWQNQPTLNFNAVKLIEQNLNWYGFSQYFKGNFEI
jgi:hypothetical protein